jgi:hypothetical protein
VPFIADEAGLQDFSQRADFSGRISVARTRCVVFAGGDYTIDFVSNELAM